MALNLIQSLIDKQDGFEIVRDQLAAILLAESINQQALAVTAGKDPNLFKLDVRTEASQPYSKFQNIEGGDLTGVDLSPIVNVWYENSNFDPSKGDTVERQASKSIFNIDIYGGAVSTSDNAGTGHIPGDKQAALEAQRALKLVRNILMASINVSLQLEPLVWTRWPQSHTMFQPQQDAKATPNIVGCRVAFEVEFNEFSPQFVGVNLDIIGITVCRESDGKVFFDLEFDTTVPPP